MSAPEILCVFYSDVSVTQFLKSPKGQELVGDLIVEVASAPTLCYALGLETPSNHPGIAGIQGSLSLTDLAVEHAELPVPAVLSAGGPVGLSAVRSALATLESSSSNYQRITLLVPTTDAATFGASLGVASQFALAWDATALPSTDLLEFAEWLNSEGFTAAENFIGMFPYTPGLLDGTAAAHVQKLGQMLGSFAEQNPAIMREVSIASD